MILSLFFLSLSYATGVEFMSVSKCLNKPNCVSSTDKREEFYVDPLVVKDFDLVVSKIKKLSGAKLKSHDKTKKTAHFVFVTKLMKFKDDVWLEMNVEENHIEIKSESRLGYSDLGANRKRVVKIRALIEAL